MRNSSESPVALSGRLSGSHALSTSSQPSSKPSPISPSQPLKIYLGAAYYFATFTEIQRLDSLDLGAYRAAHLATEAIPQHINHLKISYFIPLDEDPEAPNCDW